MRREQVRATIGVGGFEGRGQRIGHGYVYGHGCAGEEARGGVWMGWLRCLFAFGMEWNGGRGA